MFRQTNVLLLFLFAFTFPFFTKAQVTYSKDIAPIIYDNCTNCHRVGEIGPMPFTNYEEVKAWGAMVKYVTEINYMPPWSPNPEFRHLLNERVLTDEEITMIGQWVDNGMPQGDPANEPELPTFPTGSQVGVPDVVLEMAEEYQIQGNNQDDYRVFVLPTGFTEDKEIACIEFRPDNKRAVHHVLIGFDISGKAQIKDNNSPGYGYTSFGDFGINEAEFLTWTYVPGDKPLVLPEGIGEIIPAGADLLIQVHYAPLPTDEVDKSSVNIFFKSAQDPIEREVLTGWVLPDNLPGGWASFWIPANQEKTFTAINFYEDNSNIPGANYDVSLIAVQPHSHLLGKSYTVFAITPTQDTIKIIDIPQWDFNWQGAYSMQKMVKVPANSTWYTIARYDNTVNNPANPSNPPQFSTWGEGTQDEMLVNLLTFVPYKEGDEEIDLGQNILNNAAKVNPETNTTLFSLNPNPAQDNISIPIYLEKMEKLSFSIYSIDGQLIKDLGQAQNYEAGFNTINVDINSLASGQYFVEMNGGNYRLTQAFIKQ